MLPRSRPLVGWVVDVQHDFMRPDGRLYVHDLFDASDAGATKATPAIVRTVAWMRAHCDVVVFTGDWHDYGDREIDPVSPDPTRGTYPPHCMGLSADESERSGAAIIPEIDPGSEVLILPRDANDALARSVAQRAVDERRAVFVQKREFSVFEGNDGANAFVEALRQALGGQPRFVVCGVATDVCVKQAVDGLLDRSLPVTVVRDATWSLGLLDEAATFGAWQARGATLAASPDPATGP
ncbi:MAG: cysteine hydrolase [Gemmatimonadaceae bacterium]|nr:cysteine hydrolase [Gemmatimonadaceae bacterium]